MTNPATETGFLVPFTAATFALTATKRPPPSRHYPTIRTPTTHDSRTCVHCPAAWGYSPRVSCWLQHGGPSEHSR